MSTERVRDWGHTPRPRPCYDPRPAARCVEKIPPVPIPSGDLILDGALTGIFPRYFFLSYVIAILQVLDECLIYHS